jgi:hypothetical protein
LETDTHTWRTSFEHEDSVQKAKRKLFPS